MNTADRLEQMADCKEVLEFIHRKDVVESQSYQDNDDRGVVVKTFSGYDRELEIKFTFDIRTIETVGDRMQGCDLNHSVEYCFWVGEDKSVNLDKNTEQDLIDYLDLSE